ncbi:hypothetical protein ACH42_15635 [Endozoicomonas sp. (ex Bugula neritina AB1)]|nr:hypothetical protein ACH42_15635 [Endozoicomonas sp. (ex Bugula neritina AB1)]
MAGGTDSIGSQHSSPLTEVNTQPVKKADQSEYIQVGDRMIKATRAQKWKARLCRAFLGLGGLNKKTHAKYDAQFQAIKSYLKAGKASSSQKSSAIPEIKLPERTTRSFSPKWTAVSEKALTTHGSHLSPPLTPSANNSDDIKARLDTREYNGSDGVFDTELYRQDLAGLPETELKQLINTRKTLLQKFDYGPAGDQTLVTTYAKIRIQVKLAATDNILQKSSDDFCQICTKGWGRNPDLVEALTVEAKQVFNEINPPVPQEVQDLIPTGQVNQSELTQTSKDLFAALKTPSTNYYAKHNLAENKWANVWGGARFGNTGPITTTAIKQGDKFFSGNKVGSNFYATQAPVKPDTSDRSKESLPSFYSAILDQNITTVANLTNQDDGLLGKPQGRTVELQYWPDLGKTERHGDIPVTTKQIENGPDFNVITLEVGEDNDYALSSGAREVKIYHFHRWPDHGVPTGDEANAFTHFSDTLSTRIESDPKVMVHCKAGVGRTGSLIVLKQLEEGIKNGDVNRENVLQKTVDLVWQGRKERGSEFVQTPTQFEFVVQQALTALDRKDEFLLDDNLYQNVTTQGQVKDVDSESVDSLILSDTEETQNKPVPNPRPKKREGISAEQMKNLSKTPVATANTVISLFEAGKFKEGTDSISRIQNPQELPILADKVGSLQADFSEGDQGFTYYNWVLEQIKTKQDALNIKPESQIDHRNRPQGDVRN